MQNGRRGIETCNVRIIGVIDLLGGRAVHAAGGDRAAYRPVAAAAGCRVDGDAVALARAYRSAGVSELYVADLDAIEQRGRDHAALAALRREADGLWLDAGISSVAEAEAALAAGATRIVVGLETLTSFAMLAAICANLDGARVAFSLDLRDGVPVPRMAALPDPPDAIAARAAAAGAGAIIVLDLARVGSGGGPDLPLLRRVRRAAPGVMLLGGGGVRGADDLARLAEAGCDGALIATALHSGALRPAHGSATR